MENSLKSPAAFTFNTLEDIKRAAEFWYGRSEDPYLFYADFRLMEGERPNDIFTGNEN